MNIQMIPLTQLVPSPANVRKTGVKTGIAELAAMVNSGYKTRNQHRPQSNHK